MTIKNFFDIAIVVLSIALYFLFIWGYFKIKKSKNSKFSTEILVVFVAILLSTLIKSFIFVYEFDAYSFNGILGSILSALFSAIGGLQFEGLPLLGGDFTAELITGNLKTLYYMSSIWSGAVFLTIVSFAISIEFANLVKLKFILLRSKLFKRNCYYYVFTAVTDDALTLAHSIEKHHKEKEEKCIIIFSGNIGAFDRLDPLCVEIFSSGYIYSSINTPVNKDQTILDTLKLSKLDNVYLFAFELNERLVAFDEKNTEVIYSETNNVITKTIREIAKDIHSKQSSILKCHKEEVKQVIDLEKLSLECKKIVDKCIPHSINFYVLTRNDTNPRAFEAGIEETFNRKFDNLNVKNDPLNILNEVSSIIWGLLSRKIQISQVNEAALAAKDFNKKRLDYLCKNNLFNFDDVSNDCYNVLTLGFGEKGQATTNQLYESSSIVDYKGKVLPFFANIFDDRLNNIEGSFMANHPMYVSYGNIEKEESAEPIINKKIDSLIETTFKNSSDSIDRNSIPVLKFSSDSCFSNNFYEYVDAPYKNNKIPLLFIYDAILVTLGEDIASIKLANSIIRKFALHFDKLNADKEIDYGKPLQIIAINVRNKQNAKQIERELLNSCVYKGLDENGKEKVLKSIKVICFGDAEEMYTYDNIIDDEEAKVYSYRYSVLYSLFEKATTKSSLRDFCNEYHGGENATLKEVILSMKKSILNSTIENEKQKIHENWKGEKSFSKMSNHAALSFKLVYQRYLEGFLSSKLSDEETYTTLLNACKLEHERWMRFHIANGFKYDMNHNKKLKKHIRIVDFDDLPSDVVIYDAINVAMSINTNEK